MRATGTPGLYVTHDQDEAFALADRVAIMADGTYMGHGWCLIIAIDGQTGEVLDRQWCAHESKAAYLTLFSRLPAPDVLIADGLRGAKPLAPE